MELKSVVSGDSWMGDGSALGRVQQMVHSSCSDSLCNLVMR